MPNAASFSPPVHYALEQNVYGDWVRLLTCYPHSPEEVRHKSHRSLLTAQTTFRFTNETNACHEMIHQCVTLERFLVIIGLQYNTSRWLTPSIQNHRAYHTREKRNHLFEQKVSQSRFMKRVRIDDDNLSATTFSDYRLVSIDQCQSMSIN